MKKIEGHVYEEFKSMEVGDASRVQGGYETIQWIVTGGCQVLDGGQCDWVEDNACY